MTVAFCQVAHGEARDHPAVRKGQEMLDAVTDELTNRAPRTGPSARTSPGTTSCC